MISDPNWDTLTQQLMKQLTPSIGYNPKLGDVFNQIVLLARASAPGSVINIAEISVPANTSVIQSPVFAGKRILSLFGEAISKSNVFTTPDNTGAFSLTDGTVLYDANTLTIFYV